MFCPKCGAFNDDSNLWCIKCGWHIASVDSEVVFENNHNENVQKNIISEKIKKEKKSKNKAKTAKVKDYLVASIIAAVLGSVAFGIVAVIFSGLTQTELAAGNMQKAAGYSEKARLFCWISLGIGLVKLVFIILMIAAILIAGAMPYLILHG